MAEDNPVDVVLTETAGDGAADDANKNKPAAEGGAKTKTVEEELAELRADRDRERQGRMDAERRANEAGGRATQSEEDLRKSHLQTMTSAIEMLGQQKDQLTAQLAAAMSEGDFTKAAQINVEISTNVSKSLEIERGKIMAETAPARETRARVVTSGDPAVEAVASGLTPLSAAWVRAHPEYARDSRKLNEMKAAHFRVISEIGEDKAESPEYFAAVEKELGLGGTAVKPNGDAAGGHGVDVVLSDAAKVTQTRENAEKREVQPPPAPASAGGTRTRTVRLTPEQQEAAKISGQSNEEYARLMLKEKAAGNIGKDRVH